MPWCLPTNLIHKWNGISNKSYKSWCIHHIVEVRSPGTRGRSFGPCSSPWSDLCSGHLAYIFLVVKFHEKQQDSAISLHHRQRCCVSWDREYDCALTSWKIYLELSSHCTYGRLVSSWPRLEEWDDLEKKAFKSFQSTSPKHAKMLCANNEQRWSTKDKYQKAKNLARLFSILFAIGSKLSSKTRPLPVILWCSSSNSCRSTSSRTRWQGSAEGTSRQSQTRRWVGCWTWKALSPNHWEADGAVIHSHACSYQIETDLAMLVDEIRHALMRHLHDTLLSFSFLPRHEHTWDI